MILGFFADFHGTHETPRCRTDDFPEVQKNKFLQILDIFDMNGCKHVLSAGDFWDSTKIPYRTVNWYLGTLVKKWCGFTIYSVAGQHEQINHTMNLDNSPYQTMISGGVFHHLGKEPYVFVDPVTQQDIHFYGKSWGEDVPAILDDKAFNVLVNHDTLVVEKIWEGQKDPKYADKFIKENKFDLVICGDNHSPFVARYRSRTLVMCGSVCRLKVDQVNFEPMVYTFDTENRKLKKHKIRIEQGVIKYEEHKKKKKDKMDLEKFVTLLEKRGIDKDFIQSTLDESKKIQDKAVRAEISNIIASVTDR